MNVVDSSGWIEFLAGGPAASCFAHALETTSELVVPSITIYEVIKYVAKRRGNNDAQLALAQMRRGLVVDLDEMLAVRAASVGRELGLHMADSIIFATALHYDATLWTLDAHFDGLRGVRCFRST